MKKKENKCIFKNDFVDAVRSDYGGMIGNFSFVFTRTEAAK